MLFNIIEKSKVSLTNLRDKLQFVNSVKRLASISIPHLIVEVLNDQNLFTESNLADWFSSFVQFVQVVISQNQLKLLGRVEK